MTFKNTIMKSLYIKNTLLLTAVFISLSCSVFLNLQSKNINLDTLPLSAEEMMEVDEETTTLPDVQIIKHILESGKRLIPTGQ